MNDSDLPGFDPAVIAIDGLVAADLGILEIYRLLFIDEELDIVFERALIALQGEDVIGFLVDDRLSDFALATHRVDGDHRPLDRQHAQQLGNGDDLVGFFPDLDLTENETLARGESRHDVDRTLGVFLLLGGFRTGPARGSCRRWRSLRPKLRFAPRPRRQSNARMAPGRAWPGCRPSGRAPASRPRKAGSV